MRLDKRGVLKQKVKIPLMHSMNREWKMSLGHENIIKSLCLDKRGVFPVCPWDMACIAWIGNDTWCPGDMINMKMLSILIHAPWQTGSFETECKSSCMSLGHGMHSMNREWLMSRGHENIINLNACALTNGEFWNRLQRYLYVPGTDMHSMNRDWYMSRWHENIINVIQAPWQTGSFETESKGTCMSLGHGMHSMNRDWSMSQGHENIVNSNPCALTNREWRTIITKGFRSFQLDDIAAFGAMHLPHVWWSKILKQSC